MNHSIDIQGAAKRGSSGIGDGHEVMPFAIVNVRRVVGAFAHTARVGDGVLIRSPSHTVVQVFTFGDQRLP